MEGANLEIREIVSPDEIAATFDTVSELRPHLVRADYVDLVASLMGTGYRLCAVVEDGVVAVAGFRILCSLAFGRFVYVDDLVTKEQARSKGYGKLLLDHIADIAKEAGCRELHLDSGVQRFDAHRFYLRERMDITCHHFRRML